MNSLIIECDISGDHSVTIASEWEGLKLKRSAEVSTEEEFKTWLEADDEEDIL